MEPVEKYRVAVYYGQSSMGREDSRILKILSFRNTVFNLNVGYTDGFGSDSNPVDMSMLQSLVEVPDIQGNISTHVKLS